MGRSLTSEAFDYAEMATISVSCHLNCKKLVCALVKGGSEASKRGGCLPNSIE